MSNKPRPPTVQPAVPASSSAPSKDRSGLIALTVAVIALSGQIVTGLLQWQANQRASDIRMVDIGIAVLRAPVSDDIANIRAWALDVVEEGSGKKFSQPQRSALLNKPFPLDPGRTRTGTILDSVPRPCEAFKRNPDGSWTQTGKIITPQNNTFEGNTFKGGAETFFLEILCGARGD